MIHGIARVFMVIAAGSPHTQAWMALADGSFAVAAGLFGVAAFRYVAQPRFIPLARVAIALSFILGVAQGAFPHQPFLAALFSICWRSTVWLAVLQLAIFTRGRGRIALWMFTFMLLLLSLLPAQNSPTVLEISTDLLLGIAMMLVVLDDSKKQIRRLAVLNRISQAISDSDEFERIVETTLDALIDVSRAKGAWFRALDHDKLRLTAYRGISQAFLKEAAEVDAPSSSGGRVLDTGEVAILSVQEIIMPLRERMLEDGFHHIVVVPVIGKSSRIGVLVLGMRSFFSYRDEDRKFLKAAANQLGMAAENRKLVQQLIRSQNEWAETFDSIPDYILVHDSEYRILRANPALLKRLAVSYTSILLQPCEAVLPQAGSGWRLCPYCDPSSSRLPEDEDPCFGGYSVVSTSAYSGSDCSKGAVHVVKDITEAKATDERYKSLFDRMREGVFVSTPEGRFVDCNEAFFRMLGCETKEELLQLDINESFYVNPEDRREFQARMTRDGFVKNFEYAMRRKDGSHLVVIESSLATRDVQGRPHRYQGVVLDVTEKNRTETELQKRNRELRVLNKIAVAFNQSFDLNEILQITLSQIVELFSTDTAAVYLLDEETNLMHKKAGHGHRSTWVLENDSFPLPSEFIETIKSERLEILGERHSALWPEVVRRFIQEEELTSPLWVILWRKEKILGMLGTSSRAERKFTTSDESVLVSVGRQLATTIEKIQLYFETRKAYEDLRRTQEQLLQSEKMSAVGQLISGVAHELNNPLTAIIGYTQLLEMETIEERAQEFVQKLHKQALRTQKIVQNLLSFARQHTPQRLHVDLRNLMEDTIALRDYDLKVNNIVVERSFPVTLPSVVADPHQVEQVYLNVINNAADAIMEGARGGRLEIKIHYENGFVITEFHDSGPGVADSKRVFDPFYTTKGVGKGTGLGLSICYGIVKEHGGEISVQNHPCGGALVQVCFPAAVGEKPMTERERIVARRESKLEGCALLMDDEDAILDLEREVLTAAGLSVSIAGTPDEALELLKQRSFDLVLMDSKMPGSATSIDVFRWIQAQRPEMLPRVVLVLSNVSDPTIRPLADAAKSFCLVKPFEVTDLLAMVRKVLQQTETEARASH